MRFTSEQISRSLELHGKIAEEFFNCEIQGKT